MVEAIPSASGHVMMYVAGEGGETGTYQENLNELGLFQDVDASNVFNVEDSNEYAVNNMFQDVQGVMSQYGPNDNSMLHAFVEGESRVVDDKVEMRLRDGTWYPMQAKMEDIDQKQNGVKWFAFNCPRRMEPRFAGLTHSGLAMKKGRSNNDHSGTSKMFEPTLFKGKS